MTEEVESLTLAGWLGTLSAMKQIFKENNDVEMVAVEEAIHDMYQEMHDILYKDRT